MDLCNIIRFMMDEIGRDDTGNNRNRKEAMIPMTKQVKSKQRVADHGEVFTAEREVKAMCDLVKQETERIDSRFLEPACGNGNFLAEILSRKLTVVSKKYKKSPYDWERNSLLTLGSIYGVDLLVDNCIECRKRLFELWNKQYKAVCQKECNEDTREAAQYILSQNIVCGNALTLHCVDESGKDTSELIVFSEWTFPINDARMQRSDFAFAELLSAEEEKSERKKGMDEPEPLLLMLDKEIKEAPSDKGVFFKNRFDVIISNPPYQLNDGGSGTGISAKPIYHLFVEQAKKLKPNYITMIIPSRWFAGGKGLNEFRESMLHDKHIKHIVDFMSSKDCFPGVNIAGGVHYFLWNRNYMGPCTISNCVANSETVSSQRALDEFDVFIRDNRAIPIIHKFLSSKDKALSQNTYTRNPFGFVSKERGAGQPIPGCENVKLISSGGVGYVKRVDITKNQAENDKYKVTIGKIVPGNGEVDTDPQDGYRVTTSSRILLPGEIHTESYLLLHAFDTDEEANHFAAYMALKFPRFMMKHTLSSMNISKKNFVFVPFLEYSKCWSDEELYKRYGLSEEEVAYVESFIRPMDIGGDDIGD